MLNRLQAVCSGDPGLYSHENLYITDAKQSDEGFRDMTFSLLETSSGLLRSSFQVPVVLKQYHGQLLISNQFAVYYHPGAVGYLCFNILSNDMHAKASRLFKNSNHALITSCFSTLSDNVFFFFYSNTATNEIFIDMLSVVGNRLSILTIPHFERYGAGTPFAMDKSKGKIVSVSAHPTQQCLIISYSTGHTQIWSYVHGYKALQSQAPASSSSSGFGEVSPSADDADDEPDSPSGKGSGAVNTVKKATASVQYLTPVALLQLPSEAPIFSSGVMRPFASSTLGSGPLLVTHSINDLFGKYIALTFNNVVTCVYDITGVLSHTELVALNPQVRHLNISIVSVFPCMPSQNNLGDAARIHYKFGGAVFDASNRFFYQCVMRSRIVAMNKDGLYTKTLTPLIYAVSLQDTPDQVLPCIGAYEIDSRDFSSPTSVVTATGGYSSSHAAAGGDLNNSHFSIDLKPRSMHVTPASSLLCLSFLTMNKLTTGKPVTNYINLVYKMCDAFSRQVGLSLSTVPLMSLLTVGPDTYLWGEKALQGGSKYVLNDKTANVSGKQGGAVSTAASAGTDSVAVTQYSLKDATPPAPTINPIVLGVKVVGDLYHVFQVHCLGARLTSSAATAAGGGATSGGRVAGETSSVSYVGKFPVNLSRDSVRSAANSAKQWLSLPEGDLLTPSESERVLLYPSGINVVQNVHSNDWWAIVPCSYWRSNTSRKRDTSTEVTVGEASYVMGRVNDGRVSADKDLTIAAGVVLLRSAHSSSAGTTAHPLYTSFRAVAVWSGPTAVTGSAAAATGVQLLALSEDGKKLKLIKNLFPSTLASSGSSGFGTSSKTVADITYPVGKDHTQSFTGVFPSPHCASGGHSVLPNRLLLLSSSIASGGGSQPVLTVTTHLTEDNVTRVLSNLSAPGNSGDLPLLVGELVHTVQWQPLPAVLGLEKDVDKGLANLVSVWQSRSGATLDGFIGVLTNQRVLLLRISKELALSVVNSVNHSSHCTLGSTTDSPVTSINWVGAALVYTTHSGAVQYLLPVSHQHSQSSSGLLCTLPYNLGSSILFSTRIVAVLPDRLVLSYVKRHAKTGSQPILSFTTRPVNPVEPLLLSCLVNQDSGSLVAFGTTQSAKHAVLQALIQYYFTPKPIATGKSISGALPTTQSTRYLIDLLSRSEEFHYLAVLVSGITVNPTELSSSTDFPRYRWISSGSKFTASLSAAEHDRSAMELLAARPELQELLLDRGAYSGGHLPEPASLLSRQISAAAKVLAQEHGLEAKAYHLYDIAGNYAAMVELLKKCAAEGEHRDTAESILNEVVKFVSSGGKVLSLDALNTSNKRAKQLFPEFPKADVAKDSTKKGGDVLHGLTLSGVESTQRDIISKRGGGIGPSASAVDTLAMDHPEDFFGLTLTPEQITADAGALFELTAGEEFERSAKRDHPSHWVDMHDQSREVDKVVGYFRFSDVIYPKEEGFTSVSVQPGARLNFVDLSPYSEGTSGGMNLELVTDSPTTVVLEESTSNVDPGEKHESSKVLYDIVFAEALAMNELKVVRGLRCGVRRGSQWDVALYHPSDSSRNKLTVELTLSRDAVVAATAGGSTRYVLLQRSLLAGGMLTDPSPLNDLSLWSLFISPEGAVCVTFERSGAGKTGVRTANSCISMDTPPPAPSGMAALVVDEEESRLAATPTWYHIAVTLNGTKADAEWDPTALVLTGHPVEVCIYVNGKQAAKGSANVADIPAEKMEQTVMFVAPNLTSGWRFTELRLWSDCRSESELESQHESILPLAIKRKRTGLRIRGTKKLFNTFRVPVLGEPSTVVCLPIVAPAGEGGVAMGVERSGVGLVGGIPLPGLAKAPLKIPKAGGLAAPTAAAVPAATEELAMAAAAASAASTDPAAPAVALTAKEKRLLAAKNKGAAPAALFAAPVKTEAPVVAAVAPVAPPVIETAEVSLTVPTSIGSLGSLEYSPDSDPSSLREPLPAAVAVESTPPGDWCVVLSQLNELLVAGQPEEKTKNDALTIRDVVNSNLQTKILSHNQALLLRIRQTDSYTESTAHITSPTDITSEALTLKVRSSIYYVSNYHTTTGRSYALSIQDETGKLPDGVILSVKKPPAVAVESPNNSRGANRARVIVAAAYHKKSIVVYDVTDSLVSTYSEVWKDKNTHTVLSEVSIPTTPVAYWTFVSPESILLVTNTMAFTWKTSAQENPAGPTAKPISARPSKILDRLDVQTPDKWKERLVLDASTFMDPASNEPWTLLVSDAAAGGVTGATVVSVHHVKSVKGISFKAASGCFRQNQLLLSWLTPAKEGKYPTEAHWTVTCLELSAIVQYFTSNASSLGSTNRYVAPFDLDDVLTGSFSVPRALWSVEVKCGAGRCPEQRRFLHPTSSLLLGHSYCIADRHFLLDCTGNVFLVNCTSTKSNGRCLVPLDSNSDGNNGQHHLYVVSSQLDQVTDSKSPALNVLVSNNRLLRVSLKSVDAFLSSKK